MIDSRRHGAELRRGPVLGIGVGVGLGTTDDRHAVAMKSSYILQDREVVNSVYYIILRKGKTVQCGNLLGLVKEDSCRHHVRLQSEKDPDILDHDYWSTGRYLDCGLA